MTAGHPLICTSNFSKTVAFYEDHFDFVPEAEYDRYCILKNEATGTQLAIVDASYPAIPVEFQKPVQGFILNFPVKDVDAAYEELYMEGLDLISEVSKSVSGYQYFLARDPHNDILIKVCGNCGLLNGEQDKQNLCC